MQVTGETQAPQTSQEPAQVLQEPEDYWALQTPGKATKGPADTTATRGHADTRTTRGPADTLKKQNCGFS